MQLPTELHEAIVRHLDRQDVASYRLVSRKFATTGLPQLFERLHFRTSLQSLQRLASISQKDCGRYVKHLLWNTTGSEYEARAFLKDLRMRDLKYVLGSPTPNLPSTTIQQTPEENEPPNQAEPNTNLGVFLLQTIFSGFSSLKGVYIITSGTHPNAFTADGYARRTLLTSPHDPWPKPWKAKHGCPRCAGLCQAIQSPGRYEMQTALLAAHGASRPLSHLRVENLAFFAAKTSAALPGYEIGLRNLTHLELVLTAPNRALSEVRAVFEQVSGLRELKLWLHSSSWWEGVDHGRSGLRLQDVFPSEDSFPYLRTLEVHQVGVSQEFMTEFLLAHAQTLRTLKMHRIRLDPQGSWPELFASVRGKLDALEVVWLHGDFEDEIEKGGWDMDAPRGRRLEAHLLGEEPECPIGEENRCRLE
ncbi:hypothetical protein BU23DRAFT_599284 [Bimuria novae-zelandiae CBS 107.79]|uniref:F-box domain-containing protein n=1 Tax=Bimuria novae-zelandiae CBS 107.79 TaxID=1447943 RepID=A0A6A5V6W2_9PLEO|nr:hypothetical protein BU23DRAFT_599284 [Bimuria novae-zelandiae CBS 107.79]